MPTRDTLPNPQPEWFNDINYNFVEHLDLRGWTYQFIIRRKFELDRWLDNSLSGKQLWNRHLARIQDATNNPVPPKDWKFSLPAIFEYSPKIAFSDEPDENDRCLHVDLCAPDKVILQNFSSWLEETRNTVPDLVKKGQLTSVHMHGWKTHQLLPLDDLLTYRKLIGTKFTNIDVFNWSYPGYESGPSQQSFIQERIKDLKLAKRQIISMAFQQIVGDF